MSTDGSDRSDPIGKVRSDQSRTRARRFYKEVAIAARGEGYAVELDGRPVKTPGKLVLVLPAAPLAEAIAAEWAAQAELIDPMSMPLTRLANSVRDQVDGREPEVRADMAKYAGSDLLCYRAESPRELVQAQAEAWDPVLDWARVALGVDLAVATGIVHVGQSAEARAGIDAAVADLHGFELASGHVMTTLLGSVVLALAVLRGRLAPDVAWSAAHIDENWQIARWGDDEEAARRRAARRIDFDAAVGMCGLLAVSR